MHTVKPGFFDYDKSKKYLECLLRKYPFVRVNVISRTSLGRGIFSLSVGEPNNSALYLGGMSGFEWMSSLVLYRFAENLFESIKSRKPLRSVDTAKAFSKLGVTIIPCVNPDSVEIAVHGPEGARSMRKFVQSIGNNDFSAWGANSVGVDISRNFPSGWDISRQMQEESGISGPSPRFFGGAYPESESETRAVTKLCRTANFSRAMVLRCHGEKIIFPGENSSTPRTKMLAKILADSCSYSLFESDPTKACGGFMKWFGDEFSRPAFELKIGKSEEPPPVSALDEIYSRIDEAMLLFSLM